MTTNDLKALAKAFELVENFSHPGGKSSILASYKTNPREVINIIEPLNTYSKTYEKLFTDNLGERRKWLNNPEGLTQYLQAFAHSDYREAHNSVMNSLVTTLESQVHTPEQLAELKQIQSNTTESPLKRIRMLEHLANLIEARPIPGGRLTAKELELEKTTGKDIHYIENKDAKHGTPEELATSDKFFNEQAQQQEELAQYEQTQEDGQQNKEESVQNGQQTDSTLHINQDRNDKWIASLPSSRRATIPQSPQTSNEQRPRRILTPGMPGFERGNERKRSPYTPTAPGQLILPGSKKYQETIATVGPLRSRTADKPEDISGPRVPVDIQEKALRLQNVGPKVLIAPDNPSQDQGERRSSRQVLRSISKPLHTVRGEASNQIAIGSIKTQGIAEGLASRIVEGAFGVPTNPERSYAAVMAQLQQSQLENSQGRPGSLVSKGVNTVQNVRRLINTLNRLRQLIQRARVLAALANPAVLVGALIALLIAILLIIFFFVILPKLNEGVAQCFPTCGVTNQFIPSTQIKLVKSGPASVTNFTEYAYNINVTYTGFGSADIQVTDRVPQGTEFVSASDGTSPVGGILTWKIASASANTTKTLSFTVRPVEADIWVENSAQAQITSLSTGGNEPATGTDCGNLSYRYYMTLNLIHGGTGLNFGDPTCQFTKDDLYTLLQQLDPNTYDDTVWFYTIVLHESGYIPVAYLPASTSGLGAYGLFQMNPSSADRGYDAGDVPWQQQVSNAVNYNNQLKDKGIAWCYWESAILAGIAKNCH